MFQLIQYVVYLSHFRLLTDTIVKCTMHVATYPLASEEEEAMTVVLVSRPGF